MGFYECTEESGAPLNLTSNSCAKPDGFKYVSELYLIPILCCAGVFCNVLAFITLHMDRERREAITLLKVLAVADGLYLLSALLRYPSSYIVSDVHTRANIELASFALINCFQTICIWIMVLVTVDRYFCVCHPLNISLKFTHRSRIYWAVAVFISGMLYNVPRFFDSCYFIIKNNCNGTRTLRDVQWTLPGFGNNYKTIYTTGWLYLILLYFLPLSVLCYMNTRLILAIRRSRQRLSQISITSSTNLSPDYNVENNATMVLVIAVIVFIICQTPEPLVKLFELLAKQRHHELKKILVTISNFLMVINSSINFFIYYLFGRRFRSVLKQTWQKSFRITSSLCSRDTLCMDFDDQLREPVQRVVNFANAQLYHGLRR